MTLVERLAPVIALPLVAFFLFASAAATTTGTTSKSAGGKLNAVAMDGALVAYDIGNAVLVSGPGQQGHRLECTHRQDHQGQRQDHRPGGRFEHRARRP